jgi:hypothetical protein
LSHQRRATLSAIQHCSKSVPFGTNTVFVRQRRLEFSLLPAAFAQIAKVEHEVALLRKFPLHITPNRRPCVKFQHCSKSVPFGTKPLLWLKSEDDLGCAPSHAPCFMTSRRSHENAQERDFSTASGLLKRGELLYAEG